MSNHKYDYLFKILIIGESGVGKTAFLLRFTDESFTGNHITKGIDFKNKIINFEDKLIKLQIWDTAGQERFRTITKTYYKGSHGIILMYDVTDQNSFKNLRNFIKQIEANAQTNVAKVLVGNNCDKHDRVVTEEEGKKLADEFNMDFFEVSHRTNQNVSEVFYYLVGEILKANGHKVVLDNKKIKNKKIKDDKFKDKLRDKKNIENISEINNKDKESKNKSNKKEIDFNKNINLKLNKFLNY